MSTVVQSFSVYYTRVAYPTQTGKKEITKERVSCHISAGYQSILLLVPKYQNSVQYDDGGTWSKGGGFGA